MPQRSRRHGHSSRKASKKPKEISFHEYIGSLPRPHPDPRLEWHIKLYYHYTRIKRKLEKLTDKPLLSNEDLKALGVVRGAAFNVDEPLLIDVEPRFFVAGSSTKVARYTKFYEEERNQKWPEVESMEYKQLNSWGNPAFPCVSDMSWFAGNCLALVEWNEYCCSLQRYVRHENPHWGVPHMQYHPTRIICARRDYIPQYGSHEMSIYKWFCYRPLLGTGFDPNPAVSHSLAILNDTFVPDDRILRSELLQATMLLRDHVAQSCWHGHHTLPILVLSFHEGGGRILQMHSENGQLHVRVSRMLNLVSEDGSVPADGRLMAQWLMAQPIGNTSFLDEPGTATAREEDHYKNRDSGTASALRIQTLDGPCLPFMDRWCGTRDLNDQLECLSVHETLAQGDSTI